MMLKKISFLILLISIAFHVFATGVFAQSDSPIPSISKTISPDPSQTPAPSGQLIELRFKVPGIGGTEGNSSPRNVTRVVRLYFFDSEINTEDAIAKPIGSVLASADFDSDQSSPTFGSFINSNIELGGKIPDGSYQIVFKMDQALSKLIKKTTTDIGGIVYEVRNSASSPIEIDGQGVILGDIYPDIKGNNIMDINDYNALVSCFGIKAESESCKDNKAADLSDDGRIDGIDYNLMFGSFKLLHSLGKPVPEFFAPTTAVRPTEKTKKPELSQKPKKADVKEPIRQEKGSNNIILPIILTIIFLGIIIVLVIKRRKALDFLGSITHKNVGVDENAPEATLPDEQVDKDFFVKKQTTDTVNNTIVLTLTDDSGPMLGYYSGKDVVDGFAHVVGVMKKEGNKEFVDITEITPVEETA